MKNHEISQEGHRREKKERYEKKIIYNLVGICVIRWLKKEG
jgi:hypothetical protein